MATEVKTIFNKVLPYGIDNRASNARTQTVSVSLDDAYTIEIDVPAKHTILIHNIDFNPGVASVLTIKYGTKAVWAQRFVADQHVSFDPCLAPSPNVADDETVSIVISAADLGDAINITYSILYMSE